MKAIGFAVVLLALAFPANGQTPAAKLSPAEQKITWAQAAIEKNPDRYQPYNDLALALARRARETSNPSYYAQAEVQLEKSFRLVPGNLEGQKVRVWVLLGKHEFAGALETAKSLNRQTPDDILIYGFLVDANIELGNYKDAEGAAQWMLDIRPGNVPGLTRAAYLRELFGDVDGAVELMNSAYQQTAPSELEDRAWILTQIAHLQLGTGNAQGAEKQLEQALVLFPGYHYALGNLAKVRSAQGKHAEAVELLRRRYQAAPHPENLYALAEALERAGRLEEARAGYAEFEQKARREMEWADNANRELISYYADHAGRTAEALRIARLEVARRHDVYTLDAYAWALHLNGKPAEARKHIEAGLAVGIRDARMFYHAGMIAAKLNDRTSAVRYLKQALELNPYTECAAAARAALEKFTAASAPTAR